MVNDFVITLANSADPDEMLCFAAVHQGFIVCARTRLLGSMVYQFSCSSEFRVKKKRKKTRAQTFLHQCYFVGLYRFAYFIIFHRGLNVLLRFRDGFSIM